MREVQTCREVARHIALGNGFPEPAILPAIASCRFSRTPKVMLSWSTRPMTASRSAV
jgi:hypothetical protein